VSERACPAWYHEDNVFRTRQRMDHAHRPIVALACRTLRERGGDVIDLGCGNGALLAKVHALEPGATPFGVERDPVRVAHARALLPRFADHFFAADLGAHPWLARERRFALAILSPRRLQEAEADAAERLRAWLRARCDRLLVYAYGRGRTEFGDLAGFARAVGIELEGGRGDARAALARRW